MNQFSRSIALWLVLGLMFLLLFNVFSRQQTREPEIVFSDFLGQVEKNQVSEVVIQGSSIHGRTTSGEHFKTYAPRDPDLVKILLTKGVRITAKPEDGDPWWMVALVQWFDRAAQLRPELDLTSNRALRDLCGQSGIEDGAYPENLAQSTGMSPLEPPRQERSRGQ